MIETGILSISWNDDVGPISTALQQIVTIIHLKGWIQNYLIAQCVQNLIKLLLGLISFYCVKFAISTVDEFQL